VFLESDSESTLLLNGPTPLRTFTVQRPVATVSGSLNLTWAMSELGTTRTSSATMSKGVPFASTRFTVTVSPALKLRLATKIKTRVFRSELESSQYLPELFEEPPVQVESNNESAGWQHKVA